jgi:hypothetical protein
MAPPRGPHALEEQLRGYYREPFGDGGMSAFTVVQPLPDGFVCEKRLDYAGTSNPVYIGFAEYKFQPDMVVIEPNTATDTWVIQKLTYDSSQILTRIQVRWGAWDNRTALFT